MSTSIRAEANRSVVVVNGADKLAINEDGSMELLTPAANPTGNDVPTVGQLPFTKAFESAEQTFSSSGLLTLAHGLGATPKLVTGQLVCKIEDLGYTVGDVVEIRLTITSSSIADNFGAQAKSDATNVLIRYGINPFIVGRWSDGGSVQITPANWRLIVRAWA